MGVDRPLKLLGMPLQSAVDYLREKHSICGMSLAILKEGVTHVAASGWANEPERIEATPDTLFQIGSISKTFTATLVMQLVDLGLLDLDSPVCRYIPDFPATESISTTITVRNLLVHTSGLRDDYMPDGDETVGEYVRGIQELGQLHAPGEYMTYSNSAYVLLQHIIETLCDNRWDRLVLERICKPLGITRVIANPAEGLRFRMSMGHTPCVEGRWPLASSAYLPVCIAGAGSVLSMTASELLIYMQAHIDGVNQKSKKNSILSQESFRAMQAPDLMMPPHSRGIYSHMGLSWFIRPDEDAPALNHDGGTSQYSFLHALPKQGVSFALFINSPSATLPEELRRSIFFEIAGLPSEPECIVPPSISYVSERYVGVYEDNFQRMEVSAAREGNLSLEIYMKAQKSRLRLSLRAVAQDEFAILDQPQVELGGRIIFLGGEEGGAEYCRMGVRMFKRVGD